MNAQGDIELVLEPLPMAVEKSGQEDPEIVRTAFGKKNRIIMGRPCLRRFEAKEFGLTRKDVERRMGEGFEIVTTSTTISFVPDFGCRFVGAEFSISFSTGEHATIARPRPTVIDIHPRESVRQENYKSQSKSSTKFKGSMSPGFAKLLGERSETKSVQVGGKSTVRDIYAFGLNGVEAGWRFQASLGHELAGIQEDLALAVRRPVNAPLFGEVKLAAEIAVESMLDRWATVVFGLNQTRSEAGQRIELVLG
jgi:hypothetical protein